MKKVVFIIPRLDNEGRPFPGETFAELQADILEHFGGFTVGSCEGGWKAPDGQYYFDENLRYEVVIDEATLPRLKAWLAKVKVLLRQEAMWLETSEVTGEEI